MKLIFYQTDQSPVLKFIKNLDVTDRAKILGCLKSLEELGFDTPRIEFRQIRGKLWEIKIKAAAYRIFYMTIRKDTLVLLHAYKKPFQKTPVKEIAMAEKRMLEIMHHENNYLN
jgi:phage-related protein